MKVNTNIRSGYLLEDVANFGCQGLKSSASFFTNANQAAEDLVKNTTDGFQSAWSSVTNWFSRN